MYDDLHFLESIMALVQCGECKAEMSEKAKQCPACGWRRPGHFWLWTGFAVFLFVALVAFGASINASNPERAKARQAVEYCWNKLDSVSRYWTREKLTVLHAACTKMQTEFDAKY